MGGIENREEFKTLLSECIDEALDKKHGERWVSAQKHYDDHARLDYCAAHWDEMQANHEYISDLRGLGKEVRKWTLKSVVTILITSTMVWLGYHLFGALPPPK